MTLEALRQAIARLIIARAEAHGNEAEQARINAKLVNRAFENGNIAVFFANVNN